MTEVRFYHLKTKTLEQALPQILSKAYADGKRVVVRTADEKKAEALNEVLWTFKPESFLPHGTKKDGYDSDQTIYLTANDENPNKADILILTGGSTSENMDGFALCCEMLEDRDQEQIEAARQRWKGYKEAGMDLTYWQQNEKGGWDKKA